MQRTFDVPPILPNSDFNELEYIQNQLDNYNPDSHSCQRCGKKIWYGGETRYYQRYVIWACNGAPKEDLIQIPCMICRQCGKAENDSGTQNGDYHHAILVGTLLPFTSYTLLFILTVLYEYFNRTTTVYEIAQKWHISINTLYKWRKRYKDHYDAWADALHRLDNLTQKDSREHPPQTLPANTFVRSMGIIRKDLSFLVLKFFRTFAFSFLQPNAKTHLRELPKNRRLRI